MNWLKRNWKKILTGFVILSVLAAAYIFYPVPPEDHIQLSLLAKNYNVKILRDTYGVPHIFGQTDADAAYSLAYAHSEDDFLTIQQVLLAPRQLKPVWFDEADIRANLESEYVPGEEK